MSKLIGTSPNQVPSNADLGSAAFMDKKELLLSRGSDVSAINAIIDEDAVAVFVYDTRKDSDGGAWRKRTQHTSWYNERLNTHVRGSRREFPAVAVIVANNNNNPSLTIYDADDPTLPMWMVFTWPGSGNDGYNLLGYGDRPTSCVYALNGRVVRGIGQSNDGIYWADFIQDHGRRVNVTSLQITGTSIADRLGTLVYPTASGGDDIDLHDGNVLDMAMTVLPNAPIDPNTRLPIPTIVVGTEDGISVLKHNGKVASITQTHGGDTHSKFVDIDPVSGAIIYTSDYNESGQPYKFNVSPIPTANLLEDGNTYTAFQNHTRQVQNGGNNTIPHFINTDGLNNSNRLSALASAGHAKYAVGEGKGLNQLLEDEAGIQRSMIAYTTESYATGWMFGNIKLATLMDTDPFDLTRRNLAPDITSWTGGTGGTVSTSGNQITISQSSGVNGRAVSPNTIATQLGKKYIFSVDAVSSTGGAYFRMEVRGPEIVNNNFTGTGYCTFDGTGGNVYVELYCMGGAGTSVTYENVRVDLVEANRAAKSGAEQSGARAMIPYGTIVKKPVASGAELVSYGGWSSSNYFEQPYDGLMGTFGTNDFCIMGWVKKNNNVAAYRRFFSYEAVGGTQNDNDAINIKFGNENDVGNGKIYAYLGTTEGSIPEINVDYVQDGNWAQFALLRRNSVYEMYIDGKLIETKPSTQSKGSTSHKIRIGYGVSNSEAFTSGEAALFRVSTSNAPSAEQIRKMYEDERPLFNENAACTLYGSSSAVTAISYDHDTELLHVGTSAGRSVFDGLLRIDNTTNAVGAAISASNGMVVEE